MAKKLLFNLDEIEKCATNLENAKTDLEAVQTKLQKAVDTLVDASGWKSDGSAAFVEKYDSSWVVGIKDRSDVMQRMIDHLRKACAEYEPIETEAYALKLDAGDAEHGGGGGRF